MQASYPFYIITVKLSISGSLTSSAASFSHQLPIIFRWILFCSTIVYYEYFPLSLNIASTCQYENRKFYSLSLLLMGLFGTVCQYAFRPLLIFSLWVGVFDLPFILWLILALVMSDNCRYVLILQKILVYLLYIWVSSGKMSSLLSVHWKFFFENRNRRQSECKLTYNKDIRRNECQDTYYRMWFVTRCAPTCYNGIS